MIRPGPRLAKLLFALCAAALVVPLLPQAAWALPVLLAALLVAALVEWRLLARTTFALERAQSTAVVIDEMARLPMRLRSSGTRALDVVLRQSWPRLADERSSTMRGRCMPGGLSLSLSLRAVERGRAEIPAPFVAASAWGLVERVTRVGEPANLDVLPDLRAIGRVDRELRQLATRGLGARVTPKLGRGREFDRLREYVLGDDMREIEWKATARHGRLITREFRIERAQDVVICLDRGHRMAARVGRLSRLDHAVNGALVVAHACRSFEDRVGMLSFAAEPDSGIAASRGSAHSRRLTEYASRVEAEWVHSDHVLLAAHLKRFLRHRSLVLVMTEIPEGDEAESLVKSMSFLMTSHLPLILVLADPELAARARVLPSDRTELSRSLVARGAWMRRRSVMSRLSQLGALVVETAPADAGIAAVNAYIDIKRRQLL